MKAFITGGRQVDDFEKLCGFLDMFKKSHNIDHVFCLDTIGVDYLVKIWADKTNTKCTMYKLDYKNEHTQTVKIKSLEIFEKEKPELLLYLSTRSTSRNAFEAVREARRRKIENYVIRDFHP
jgi:Ran GTPase-activating protein (RanGAP) involved in mRNA processing and transport